MSLLRVLMDIGDKFQQPITIVNMSQSDQPLIYLNQAFKDLTLYQNDQIIGKNCRFLQGTLTDKTATTRIRETLDARNPICQDLLNYKSNGEIFYNRLVLIPFRENGVQFYIGLQHEIKKDQFKPVHLIKEMDLLDRTINPLSIIAGLQMTKLPDYEKPLAKTILRLKTFVLSL